MIRRAPQIGESGYPRIAFDNYRTPLWVTETLVRHVRLPPLVWEPAAGEMDMANALRSAGIEVFASDIRDLPGLDSGALNFLDDFEPAFTAGKEFSPEAVVTNPPFSLAEAFIARALKVTEECGGVVAMLLLHDYDTALKTRGWMFRDHPAFAMKITLGRRIKWIGLGDKASPRQNHAWYVWDWRHGGPARCVYAEI